jgi:hypothetical protein
MTFAAFETTDGSPIELITFENGAITHRYSNTVLPYTVGINTFEPLAYSRNKFSQSKDSDDNNITLNVPAEIEIAALYNGVLTSNMTFCTIERIHFDDPDGQLQTLWRGRVVVLNRQGNRVDILMQPITSGAESTPRDVFSGLCNAFLFQTPGCLLVRENWKFDGTIDALNVAGDEITVNGLRAQAVALDAAQGHSTEVLSVAELDTYWQGGYIEVNGEIRDIVQGDFGGDPDAFRIDQPFRSIATTNPCTVYAGCTLTRDICNRKFDNVLNFQGYPDIPEIDPANTELPPGASDDTFKFTSG